MFSFIHLLYLMNEYNLDVMVNNHTDQPNHHYSSRYSFICIYEIFLLKCKFINNINETNDLTTILISKVDVTCKYKYG